MPARFQAEIQAEHLRALSHLAPTKDVRFYLNGVQVFAAPEVTLAATDGSRIGVLRTGQLASAQFEIRIPIDTIKQLGKFTGVVVLASEDGQDWTLKAGALSLGWKAEDERYPQVWRAIPSTVSGEAGLFDLNLLPSFSKAAKDLGAGSGARAVLLGQNGAGTALVSMPECPEFVGALAPLRKGMPGNPDPLTSAPAWAIAPIEVPADWRTAKAAEETCDLA